MPISAWASPLGISFGHQVADDAKTGSGTTEKLKNHSFLGELAGEPGFEPRLTESESVVLPLNYSPATQWCVPLVWRAYNQKIWECKGLFPKNNREFGLVFSRGRISRVLVRGRLWMGVNGASGQGGQASKKQFGEKPRACYSQPNETDNPPAACRLR